MSFYNVTYICKFFGERIMNRSFNLQPQQRQLKVFYLSHLEPMLCSNGKEKLMYGLKVQNNLLKRTLFRDFCHGDIFIFHMKSKAYIVMTLNKVHNL